MSSPEGETSQIAVIKPCCLGDCVMALPAVDSLVAAFPTADVDVFVGRHSSAAFAFRPQLHLRFVPDTLDAGSAAQLSRRLREGRYQAVVCLDRSRWLKMAIATSRARTTASVRSQKPERRHEIDAYLDVVRELSIPIVTSEPAITPSDSARRRTDELLRKVPTPFVVLHPGGANNPGVSMLDKRWPAGHYVQVARWLAAGGFAVLLSGSQAERELCQMIASDAGLAGSSVLAGETNLPELAAILERSALYVGPDTGVSHIAAATGTPTIAIFGPTNPSRYGPRGRCVRVLAPAASWTIPDRDLRTASIDQFPSTRSVSADDIIAAARELLDAKAASCR